MIETYENVVRAAVTCWRLAWEYFSGPRPFFFRFSYIIFVLRNIQYTNTFNNILCTQHLTNGQCTATSGSIGA